MSVVNNVLDTSSTVWLESLLGSLDLNRAMYAALKTQEGLYLGNGIDICEFFRRGQVPVREVPVIVSDQDRPQHMGCLGTTGCGKTTLARLMIMQDILKGRNLLVIDPKGDMDLLSSVIETTYYSNRLQDFMYVSPIHPEVSLHLNLLQYYKMPDEIIDHIVSGIRAKEEYFVNVAQEVSTVIVQSLLLLEKVNQKHVLFNFFEIKKWCSYSGLEQLLNSIRYLTTHHDREIADTASEVVLAIEQILRSPQDFFAKVSSSLRTVLTALSSSTTGRIIGKAKTNEFIKRLESGKGVILYCNTGSLLARRTSVIIAKVLISMIQACMGRLLAQGKRFDPPLCLYLDEGHNVLYWGIQELFNKGRAANVWIHFFTQSFAQIQEAVGEEVAASITDNITTWLYMRLNCEASATRIVESLPVVRKKLVIHDFPSGIYNPIVRETEAAALTVTSLMQMPNRHYLIKLKNNYIRGEVCYISEPSLLIKMPEEVSLSQEELELAENKDV